MSSRVYLFFPPRGREPPPTLRDRLSPHISLQRRRFPILPRSAMPNNARMSLCTQSVHSFLFPPRPLRTAPSRIPNTIRFGSRPPLIRMSAPAHSILVQIKKNDGMEQRGFFIWHCVLQKKRQNLFCSIIYYCYTVY